MLSTCSNSSCLLCGEESWQDTATPLTRDSWGHEHTERNKSIVWRAATVAPACWPFDRHHHQLFAPRSSVDSHSPPPTQGQPQTSCGSSDGSWCVAAGSLRMSSLRVLLSISIFVWLLRTRRKKTDGSNKFLLTYHKGLIHKPIVESLPCARCECHTNTKIPIPRTKTRSQTHFQGVPWLFQELIIINVTPTSPPQQPLPRSMDGTKCPASRSF